MLIACKVISEVAGLVALYIICCMCSCEWRIPQTDGSVMYSYDVYCTYNICGVSVVFTINKNK